MQSIADESLQNYRIVHNLRQLYEVDWQGLIGYASEEQKKSYEAQRRALRLVLGFVGLNTSPELLGWYSIWTRTHLILQSSIDLDGRLSVGVARYLDRVLIETATQVRIICRPLDDYSAASGDKRLVEVPDAIWGKVRDRFRGYFSWLLVNDLCLLRRNLTDARLAALHGATKRHEVLIDGDLGLYAGLFGDQEIIGENEARMELMQAKDYKSVRVNRLIAWLNDSRLGLWRFNDLSREIKNRIDDNQPPSLQEYLDFKNGSAYAAIKDAFGEHIYFRYAVCSNLIHGSTLEFTSVIDPSGTVISRDGLFLNYPEDPSPAIALGRLARPLLVEIAAIGAKTIAAKRIGLERD